eukprot:38521-Pelagomonas_calceolata.AAC.2
MPFCISFAVSSGGALFNAQGQVVGMVAPCLGSATSRASGCGLGYAVPIDAFRYGCARAEGWEG